jgi:S1-C subfamily serine protease
MHSLACVAGALAYVKSVDANGPAARASILVGDILRSIEGERLTRGIPVKALQQAIESGVDKPIKLGFERGDKELEVTLTLETKP